MHTIADKNSKLVFTLMGILFVSSIALKAWRTLITHDFVIVDDVSEENAET